MENTIFAANGVLPIFFVMIIGNILKNKKILSDEFYNSASKFVFMIATPALLFSDTASVNFYETFDFKFVASLLGTLLVFVILLWIIIPAVVKDRVKAGAVIHCGYRSNFAILGLPLLKNLLDISGVAKAEIILAFGIPLFNVVAVVCLSYFSSAKGDYKKVLKNTITNPLIIGALAGVICSACKFEIPAVITKTISYVGDTALGIGLIVLGASFDINKFLKSFKVTFLATIVKIVISPLFGVLCMYLLGYRNDELVITFVYMGSSTAINSFIMAKEMKSDEELTAGAVVCTTGFSILTLFIGIYLLKLFGM